MSILSLVPHNSDILRLKIPPFDFNNTPVDPIQLAKDLSETMLHYNALGLAANQCGLLYRCFAVRSNPVLVMFNLVIVDSSKQEIELPEGCLSFPGVMLKLKRPKSIKVRFRYPNGETLTEKYTDLTARIIQHENDHLDGITFVDKISKMKKGMAFKKANKILGKKIYFVS